MKLTSFRPASIRLGAILALSFFAVSQMAQAGEYKGTKKEQDACQADVFRVCDDAVPDEQKIIDCLNKRLPDLSAACQRLVEPDPKKRTKEF